MSPFMFHKVITDCGKRSSSRSRVAILVFIV